MPSVVYYNCTNQLNVDIQIQSCSGTSGATLSGIGAGTYNVKGLTPMVCTGVNTATG